MGWRNFIDRESVSSRKVGFFLQGPPNVKKFPEKILFKVILIAFMDNVHVVVTCGMFRMNMEETNKKFQQKRIKTMIWVKQTTDTTSQTRTCNLISTEK